MSWSAAICYSRICIGQNPVDTEYISANALKATDFSLEEGDAITVAQIGEDGIALSETEKIIFSFLSRPG